MPRISTEWNVQWDGPITLPALTRRMQEEGLGREDLITVLEGRNEELRDAFCGKPYHPTSGGRYRRAGTKERTLGTIFGRITIRVGRVKDLVTGRTIIPVWDDVIINAKKVYQDDIIAASSHSAIRMTYRNTKEITTEFVEGVPSPRTVNRSVIEHGSELLEEIHQRELTATTHQPDGTKLFAQERGKHDVNLVLATGPGKRPRLRSLTVGQPWKNHLPPLSRTQYQDGMGGRSPPTVVSDLEKGLAEMMTPTGGYWQPCLVHVIRNTGHSLWWDDLEMGTQKKAIMNTVTGLVMHLVRSVEYHLPRGEHDAVRHRMKQTTKEFRRLATRLAFEGLSKTATFLHEISTAVTTFAALALQGIMIPWHNNLVERLMGEIAKRCKHKWMSWTSRGAQALLALLVTKVIEPDTHESFWHRKLYGALRFLSDLGIRISYLGRKVSPS